MFGRRLIWNVLKSCLFCLAFVFSGCEFSSSKTTVRTAKDIYFACWNAQTFFDANEDGCEYSEFKKAENWNKNSYLIRLQRLAEVIKELNCDVFVLEEIENEAVVMDILNQLAGSSWNSKKNWNYTCFAKEAGASIGCAVFSKFPLGDIKTHSMDVRVENSSQPSCRPIIQVSVIVGDAELVVFVNHWKSKSGSEDSEVWRNWQESLLTDRICKVLAEKDGNVSVVACGDFNRDISEFKICASEDGNVLLRNFHQNVFENGSCIPLLSSWLDSDGLIKEGIGSYYYKNKWERIDQIFSCGKAKISEFESFAREPWASEDGVPVSYSVYTGNGYSDHLPLRCKISLF